MKYGVIKFFIVSALPVYMGIILMDYTTTSATRLDNKQTVTQERAGCVIAFLDEVLGDEFNFTEEVVNEEK
jgi:hypothetical protein